MYADNLLLCFSFLSLRLCLCLRRPDIYKHDATTQAQAQAQENENGSIPLYLCLRRCVVRVNRTDAIINTSASTRPLCLRCTGLITRRFLVTMLVLMLMLASYV